jgi:hypothetical protein
MSVDRSQRDDPTTGVAERMADAILYLSSVARSAGLSAISEDLLSIRTKLQKEDETTSRVPKVRASDPQKARGARR